MLTKLYPNCYTFTYNDYYKSMIELDILKELGLSDKEAKIYLALIEFGSATAGEISKKTNLKRPTVYALLDSLKQQGLVDEKSQNLKTIFSAQDPARIQKDLKQKLTRFEDILPVLKARFNRGKKPKVRYYEGAEVIRNFYLNEVLPAEKVYYFGTSIKKFNQTFPDIFPIWEKHWWPKKKTHPHQVLELVGNAKEDIQYAKSMLGIRQVRIFPPQGKRFLADSVIADNKIVIISLENLFALVIESDDLAETYRNIIEFTWQHAIPADKWKE